MKSGPYRLPRGGRTDRSQARPFSFDGRRLSGFAGDTLASALLANQVRIVSRSMKSHRPRGVFSRGIEEPNALVHVGEGAVGVPSARATVTPLTEGLVASAQAGWPSVRFDMLRVLDALAPRFVAGFYNKTFMWPTWHCFEPVIRRLAGLGRVRLVTDTARYDVRNGHCDVLVVGAGVAGMSAALGAARRGLRVWRLGESRILQVTRLHRPAVAFASGERARGSSAAGRTEGHRKRAAHAGRTYPAASLGDAYGRLDHVRRAAEQ